VNLIGARNDALGVIAMAIYVETESLSRFADVVAALKPCSFTGKVTPDQVKIALGEHLDIWPVSIAGAIHDQ
jgi:predicted metallo-beta-lactamase superfamily hydrolase